MPSEKQKTWKMEFFGWPTLMKQPSETTSRAPAPAGRIRLPNQCCTAAPRW